MLSKVILGLVGVAFSGYGILVLFSPDLIAEYIGYSLVGPDSRIELLAMYGGLELGFGLFCVAGVLKQSLTRPALLSIIFIVGGLAITRTVAFLVSNTEVTEYTHGALVFEIILTSLALIAYLKHNELSA